MAIKLFGSITSPFVRRVRVVAQELGVDVNRIDSTTEAGQVAMRAVTPIWKVPVAEFGREVVFDSRVIIDRLLLETGPGPLRLVTPVDRWQEANIINTIDAAAEAAINVRYIRLDGVDIAGSTYLSKQKDRVGSAMAFIAAQLKGVFFSEDKRLGLSEIALLTTLEWMVFRDEFPVRKNADLAAFVDAHQDRPSFASTRPA